MSKILRGEKYTALIISILFLLFYIYFQSSSVFGGDAGDLVSAALMKGVAHPPGYPLYTFLGWLLTKIPISTVAWRVGLLSSIPSAISLGLIFLTLTKLTKHFIASIIGVFILGFSYLFWLYAIVPEVFGLNTLFVALLFYLLLLYRDTGHRNILHISSFIFGLSLTHHHVILFIIPAYILLIVNQLKKIKNTEKTLLINCGYILLGLTPYVYVYLSAKGNPPVNWENPQTVQSFLNLISRSLYGSFQSHKIFNVSIYERIFQLKIMFDTYLIDFTKLGIALALIGMWKNFRENKNIFLCIVAFFLLSGPIFIFYAGFPSSSNFFLGTSERFLLTSYIFITIWIVYGIKSITTTIDNLLQKITSKKVFISSIMIFPLFALLILYGNWIKLSPIKNDFTAEKLGKDIFNTVPDNSVIFFSDDTSTFDSLYVYYVGGGKKGWRGIKHVQTGIISSKFYNDILKREFPEMLIELDKGNLNFTKFVDDYIDVYPIYSFNIMAVSKKYTWVPDGLMFRLYKTSDVPLQDEFKKRSIFLFSQYQNPLKGALGVYKHVMLADVLRVYATAHIRTGQIFYNFTDYEQAEKHFLESINLQGDDYNNYLFLADTYIVQKKCADAENILFQQVALYSNIPEIDKNIVKVYKECFHDQAKTDKYQKIYDEKVKKSNIQLNQF